MATVSFLALLFGLVFPAMDGDVFWQVHLGRAILSHHAIPNMLGNETYTAAGSPWVAQEWLSGILLAVLYPMHAMWVFSGLMSICAILALLTACWRARRFGASGISCAVAAGFALVQMSGTLGPKVQIVDWLGLSALLWLLECDDWKIYLILPLVVAWANLHAGAMLAIAVLGLHAVCALIMRKKSYDWRKSLAIAVLALPCLALTPLGLRLPVYAVVSATAFGVHAGVGEWGTALLTRSFIFGGLPLLFLVLTLRANGYWRWGVFNASLIMVLLAAAIDAVRYAPLLCVAILPFSALGLDRLLERPLNEMRGFAIMLGGAVLAVALVPLRAPGAISSPPLHPGPVRLYCQDFADCNVAMLAPDVRVFIDGRWDPYPSLVREDYWTVYYVKPGWLRVLRDTRTQEVLAVPGTPLDVALSHAGWYSMGTMDHRRMWLSPSYAAHYPAWMRRTRRSGIRDFSGRFPSRNSRKSLYP